MQARLPRPTMVVILIAILGAPSFPGQNTPADLRQHQVQTVEEALHANDFAGAEKAYRAMLALDPKDSQAWMGLGVLLYGSGKAELASEALQRSLEIDPSAR